MLRSLARPGALFWWRLWLSEQRGLAGMPAQVSEGRTDVWLLTTVLALGLSGCRQQKPSTSNARNERGLGYNDTEMSQGTQGGTRQDPGEVGSPHDVQILGCFSLGPWATQFV